MTFQQFLHPRQRRVTHVGLVVLWSLVAFYILASARALIPGLCATQAAMDAQCHVAETGSCCATTEEPAESQPDAPVTPAESGCAFCNLLIAHTDPPLLLSAVLLPTPAPPAYLPESEQRTEDAPRADAPNRAPPIR